MSACAPQQHGTGWDRRDRRDMPAEPATYERVVGVVGMAHGWGSEKNVRTFQRGPMVTIDGLEPAEHAAPAYNMCAGPRWLEHSRRLSMAARQTLHRGLARCTTCQRFSTWSVSRSHDAVDISYPVDLHLPMLRRGSDTVAWLGWQSSGIMPDDYHFELLA